MVNIGPTIPTSPSAKSVAKTKTRPVSVGVSKQTSSKSYQPVQDRRSQDRRQRDDKPLVDLRSGRDRRRHGQSSSIDIQA